MIRDKRLFAFLKDRHILNPAGAKDLHSYLTRIERRTEQRDAARIKKHKKNKMQ